MKIKPHDYWRVLNKYADAQNNLLAYRLACSRIHFDVNHRPLVRSELEHLVGEGEVDEDYPETVQEMQAELSEMVLNGLTTKS
jgi:hypothetical protein